MEMSIKPPLADMFQLTIDPAFTVLAPSDKKPVRPNWQDNPMSPDDVWSAHQTNQNNIGLLNGSTSGIVDVDLDCKEAAAFAPLILPTETLATFKHDGNARGHVLYRTHNAGNSRRINCPETNDVLVELRSNGSQTMLPPSIHPSGHPLYFTAIHNQADEMDFAELDRSVSLLAAVVLIARNWQTGVRHDLALGFAGLLRKAGYSEDKAKDIVQAICDYCRDVDVKDRINCVATTYAQPTSNVAGYMKLADTLGGQSAKRLSSWLGTSYDVSPSKQRPVSIMSGVGDEDHGITEARMGEAFSKWAQGKALYVAENCQWYLWNGVIWKPDICSAITVLFDEFLSEAKQDPGSEPLHDALRYFENRSKIGNALFLAQPRLACSAEHFDQEHMVFAAKDTWIDLTTGHQLDPAADKKISLNSEVVFDANATCPTFLKFVDEICCGQDDLAAFIKRAIGYSLTGSTEEQCFFVLNGNGANGKSTFINIINKLLGRYAKAAPEHTFLSGQRNGVGDDLIYLTGARFISVAELDHGQSLAEAKIKRITGGDQISGRALYGVNQEQRMIGKIFLATNNLPTVKGRDNGIYRRFRIIPFDRTFASHEQDGKLFEKLEAELSGILNWAIEGCLEWQSQGLNPPKIVTDQLEHYIRDTDTVRKYFEAELDISVEDRVPSSRLFQTYREWCSRMGYSIQDDRQFKAALEQIEGVTYKKTKKGRFFEGVRYRVEFHSSVTNGPEILF